MELEKIIAEAVASAVKEQIRGGAQETEPQVVEPTEAPGTPDEGAETEANEPQLKVEVVATSTLTSSQKAR